MKLQTQFTVPNKDRRDFDYVNEVEVLKKLLRENVNITQLKKIV